MGPGLFGLLKANMTKFVFYLGSQGKDNEKQMLGF